MSNHWSNKFVGTPYVELGRDRMGCDCWGLACVIYREELNISLPDYLGSASPTEHDEIGALISKNATSPLWVPVAGTAVAFDVAVFRRGRLNAHVGIVIRHGLMLHMVDDDCAKIANYKAGAWGNRLSGVYRHVEMISKASA